MKKKKMWLAVLFLVFPLLLGCSGEVIAEDSPELSVEGGWISTALPENLDCSSENPESFPGIGAPFDSELSSKVGECAYEDQIYMMFDEVESGFEDLGGGYFRVYVAVYALGSDYCIQHNQDGSQARYEDEAFYVSSEIRPSRHALTTVVGYNVECFRDNGASSDGSVSYETPLGRSPQDVCPKSIIDYSTGEVYALDVKNSLIHCNYDDGAMSFMIDSERTYWTQNDGKITAQYYWDFYGPRDCYVINSPDGTVGSISNNGFGFSMSGSVGTFLSSEVGHISVLCRNDLGEEQLYSYELDLNKIPKIENVEA